MPKISRQNIFIYVRRDGLTVSKGNTAAWRGVGVGVGEEWGLHNISSPNALYVLFNMYSRSPKFVITRFLTFLKPTGHVMHQQFNIQQLYVLPTLYLCVLYLSENKQRLVPLTA
jgi:hypothetical protein